MDERSRLEQLATASLTDEDCPDAEHLADYMLGGLTGNTQLVVAAHVRTCPLCQYLMTTSLPPEPKPRLRIAQLAPQPLLAGRRSGSHGQNVRQYLAADVIVELTIAPPTGDYWRITGRVLRAEHGLEGCTAILRAGRRHYRQVSDGQGFFTFDEILPGSYTLTVSNEDVQVQIRALVLEEEDPAI